ncbi:fluoride efflux transporter FluC [Nocardia vulneris]|uniref:Fluoride-specific ion channel FluC n=1 Tax=Nocardia vulneris TaxID=1141657 RepID=A0ABR4Z327_9NOCA|nr:CrcB family protein [Nocardia vulneris]KIA59683.1 CrcB protein [Nocardia vulneris]
MTTTGTGCTQTDIDPDLFDPAPLRARVGAQAPILAVIALGGALGAALRYGAALIWPTAPGAFPVTTMIVNITGCAAMGIFMVLITEAWTAPPLLRPFVGTGLLGGYTTFSTYAADSDHLIQTGSPAVGLAVLVATPVAALVAIWTAAGLARRFIALGARRVTLDVQVSEPEDAQ